VAPALIRFRDLPDVLDVSPATAARYAKRRDFPKAQLIAGIRVWNKAEIRRWGKENRRHSAGPRRPDACRLSRKLRVEACE